MCWEVQTQDRSFTHRHTHKHTEREIHVQYPYTHHHIALTEFLLLPRCAYKYSDVVLRIHFPLIQAVKHVVVGLKALQNLYEVHLTAPRKQRAFQNKREENRYRLAVGLGHIYHTFCRERRKLIIQLENVFSLIAWKSRPVEQLSHRLHRSDRTQTTPISIWISTGKSIIAPRPIIFGAYGIQPIGSRLIAASTSLVYHNFISCVD